MLQTTASTFSSDAIWSLHIPTNNKYTILLKITLPFYRINAMKKFIIILIIAECVQNRDTEKGKILPTEINVK